jgi:DNA-binding MarR family transcriptional regulator
MENDLVPNDYLAFGAFHDQLERVISATQNRAHEAGLEPLTFRTLLVLRRKPSGIPVGKLASMIGIDRNATVELVERLVRRRFVERRRDLTDRRRALVTLTPAGAAWIQPVTQDALRDVVASGPDLMRALRLVIAHAGNAEWQTHDLQTA